MRLQHVLGAGGVDAGVTQLYEPKTHGALAIVPERALRVDVGVGGYVCVRVYVRIYMVVCVYVRVCACDIGG